MGPARRSRGAGRDGDLAPGGHTEAALAARGLGHHHRLDDECAGVEHAHVEAPASLLPGWCRGTNRRVLPAPNAISRGARAEGGRASAPGRSGGSYRAGPAGRIVAGLGGGGASTRTSPGTATTTKAGVFGGKAAAARQAMCTAPSARRLAGAVMSIFTPRARAWRAAVSVSQAPAPRPFQPPAWQSRDPARCAAPGSLRSYRSAWSPQICAPSGDRPVRSNISQRPSRWATLCNPSGQGDGMPLAPYPHDAS